jgi:hypothetical protein
LGQLVQADVVKTGRILVSAELVGGIGLLSPIFSGNIGTCHNIDVFAHFGFGSVYYWLAENRKIICSRNNFLAFAIL